MSLNSAITDKKILILGASSYIGRQLLARLGPDRAVGTYFNTPFKDGVYFDILKMDIPDILDDPQELTHAVILSANSKPDFCVKHILESTFINVTRMREIADQLKSFGIIPLFVSTEAVFDGQRGNYIETDPVNPILVYGEQKAQMEQYLLQTNDKSIIVRLAKVYGTQPHDGTFLTKWLEQLESGETIMCARDQVTSPIHVDEVAEAVTLLIEQGHKGIFHICSKVAYSRSGLLKLLIKYYRRYKQNEAKVVECSINDFPVLEKRPLNISMRPDKLIKASGIQINDVEHYCDEITRNAYGNKENKHACQGSGVK